MVRTIHQSAEEIRAGKITPVDLLDECLAQIDRLESKVRAWVFVDRDRARAQAEERTKEVKEGKYRGPLHGIPIGIKDIFDVFDWPTAAGSKLWANSIARQDATVVARLRTAGAVFLGKTVTTQYASFDPPVTRNPWNLSRTPGGSSSGSAAALACGMCLGATASQTGGSITRPAAYCGVAGLKPSFGLLDCTGVVPLAPSMDHPGPMARCVRDLGHLLEAMLAGAFGFMTCRSTGATQAPRLGRVRGLFQDRAEPIVVEMMDRVCAEFQKRGAQIDEVALPTEFAEVITRHRTVMAVEAAAYHEERLQRHPEDYSPEIRALVEEGLKATATQLSRTKQHQEKLIHKLLNCFEYDTDRILLTPATTGPAPDAKTTGNPAFNSPWSYVGFPTLSIPAAWTKDGLPLAIQLVSQRAREERLLAAAAWCEEALAFEPRTVKFE